MSLKQRPDGTYYSDCVTFPGVQRPGDGLHPDDPLLKRETVEFFTNGKNHYADFHQDQLKRWTFPRLRDYVDRTVPDYVLKSGKPWKPPDCTLGILRYNSTGMYAGFVRCNQWKCPDCAEAMKGKLIERTKECFGDEKCFFITMTVDSSQFDDRHIIKGWQDEDGKKHASAFARLRASLHKYGFFRPREGHKFIWVQEFTPPSHPYRRKSDGKTVMSVGNVRHVHMLTNFDIPEVIRYTTPIRRFNRVVTLKSLWRKATDGTSHQIDVVRDTEEHGAVRASYMAKYISKGVNGESPEHGFQKFERRFGKSIGLFRMRPESQHLCFLQLLDRGKPAPPL